MTTYRPDTTDLPWKLARLAGCSDPSALDSAGAHMLATVRDNLAEAIDYQQDNGDLFDRDSIHEQADAAPSIYTFTRWQEFTDLAAWQEDTTEYGDLAEDMTERAGVALYIIADRLIAALLDEWEV